MPDAVYDIQIGGGAEGHERSLQQLVGMANGYGVNNSEYALPFRPYYDGSGFVIDGARGTGGGTLRLLSAATNHLTLQPSGATSGLGWTVASLTSAGAVQVNGPLSVTGNTTLGDASGDTLTVHATSTFNAPVTANGLTVTGAASFTGNVTVGDAAGDALTVNATPTFKENATFEKNVTVQGNTALGNADTDTVTVIGVSTFRNAANSATQLYVDAGNNRVIVGSATTIGSDTTPNLQVIGRLYVAPESSSDQALQIRRSNGATVGWWVGMPDANDLRFRDTAGSETFRIGASGSTYQATVTGDFNVSDYAVISGDASVMGWATIGTNTRSGSETLRVLGQSKLDGAVTITTGGLGVTGSAAFNSGLTVVSGGLTVTTGGMNVTGLFSLNAGGNALVEATNILTSGTASGGGGGAVPANAAIYFYVRIGGTFYRVPAFN